MSNMKHNLGAELLEKMHQTIIQTETTSEDTLNQITSELMLLQKYITTTLENCLS